MTQVLVFSDSHQAADQLRTILEQNQQAKWVVHLGDGYRDLEEQTCLGSRQTVVTVRGNSDILTSGDTPPQRIIAVEDARIMLCHGHQYQVKWTLDNLCAAARDLKVDAVLYGHTHVPFVQLRQDGLWIMNPGSIGAPRSGAPSYGVVEVNGRDIICKIVEIPSA